MIVIIPRQVLTGVIIVVVTGSIIYCHGVARAGGHTQLGKALASRSPGSLSDLQLTFSS